jgi:quercetin dioxygenase-like cupin family protein
VRDPATLQKPLIQDLITESLKSTEGLEVVVSHVALPPNLTLPMHWHPGEEFAYILQGSVTLILDGEGEQEAFSGDVGVVPLKKVHTARSATDFQDKGEISFTECMVVGTGGGRLPSHLQPCFFPPAAPAISAGWNRE